MKNKLLLIGLWCSTVVLAQEPQVTNVRFEQRTDGSLLVDVYYDVTDINAMDISLKASDNGGASWELNCLNVIGDVGSGISLGTNKHIVWDFYTDNPGITGNNFKVRVIAEDYLITGTVTDYDGNVYQTVKIGDQWWMAENLNVTHYSNGDPIPYITVNAEWANLTTGAYCYYDNNSIYAADYGALYNWYAVNDSRNIAPTGWHVPTSNEWLILINYLGGDDVAGGKLKETGTTFWNSPNTGANNESGFNARPGGLHQDNGYFGYNIGLNAFFWSTQKATYDWAWYRKMSYDEAAVQRLSIYPQSGGMSIRCVKN